MSKAGDRPGRAIAGRRVGRREVMPRSITARTVLAVFGLADAVRRRRIGARHRRRDVGDAAMREVIEHLHGKRLVDAPGVSYGPAPAVPSGSTWGRESGGSAAPLTSEVRRYALRAMEARPRSAEYRHRHRRRRAARRADLQGAATG
jgi:hypothetical protein